MLAFFHWSTQHEHTIDILAINACIFLQWLEDDLSDIWISGRDLSRYAKGLTRKRRPEWCLVPLQCLGLGWQVRFSCAFCCATLIFYTYIYLSTAKSFVDLVKYLFTLPSMKSFLCQRICQDPLENFSGCQRQRGVTHDNPSVKQFLENTEVLRMIDSLSKRQLKWNCRGGIVEEKENECLH